MVVIVFVIKTVKMKYSRIDIKWRHVSTAFKIYLEMLSYFITTLLLSIEEKIKYSRQAAYSQLMGFAINILHAQ
jgi:hypothetical protein